MRRTINRYQKNNEYETIDLATYSVDVRAVEKIPRQIASRYMVLAVRMEGSQLMVVTWNPLNLYALEDIRLVTNMRIMLVLSRKEEIEGAINLYYLKVGARSVAIRADTYENLVESYMEELAWPDKEMQAPIVRLLNSLLLKAYNTNVSDIHIEPYEHGTVIRMRRDGILKPYMMLLLNSHRGMVVRIKILVHMDIAEKRKAQDRHFRPNLHGTKMNVRVSFVPTVYGEKCVLRFLTTNTIIDYTDTFGMTPANYEKMKRLLKNPHGIIYVADPTESEKTTTLHEVLKRLADEPINIMTIEDPVEQNMPKLNQIQVNERAKVTFDPASWAVLRQDPDIIMVGETRDLETVATSARASITGYPVFSTFHTSDAVSAAIRLQDMGVPSYMVAASVVGVVAQRLVRKVCPYRGEEYEAGDGEKAILYRSVDKAPASLKLKKGKGCHLCNDTGYRGRIAIHEILEMDSGLRKLVSECKMIGELEEYAVHTLYMSTLAGEARILVLDGITDIKEMEKITYSIRWVAVAGRFLRNQREKEG